MINEQPMMHPGISANGFADVMETYMTKLRDMVKSSSAVGDILIVEDNPYNAEIQQLLVERLGYPVTHFRTGEEALEFCEKQAPRLILMDLGLPGLDGMEVTERLMAMPHMKGIPILAVTAHVSQGMREKAEQSGCMMFIAKPFLPSDFLSMLKRALSETPS